MISYFKSSYALGIFFIFSCAVIWAGASVLIQYIYQDLNFQSPFLVTYLANSLLVFYLPLWQMWICCGVVKKYPLAHSSDNENCTLTIGSARSDIELECEQDYSPVIATGCCDDPASRDEVASSCDNSDGRSGSTNVSHKEVMAIAMMISPVWFVANCLYNYSLLMTSNSSSTIISNLSASFTLAFSWYVGLEQVTYCKLMGILVCFAGAVTVGQQDTSSSSEQTVAGDVVALLAAAGYGVYTTMLRYKIKDDEGVSMQLLLGYIGLFNLVLLSPIVLILFFLGLANLNHLTGTIFGFIVLNGFCDNVVSDYLWARSVVLTSPTVATIGMSITIPLAMMSDFLLGKEAPSDWSLFGAFLVLVGFLLVNVTAEMQEDCLQCVRKRLSAGSVDGTSQPSQKDGYMAVESK